MKTLLEFVVKNKLKKLNSVNIYKRERRNGTFDIGILINNYEEFNNLYNESKFTKQLLDKKPANILRTINDNLHNDKTSLFIWLSAFGDKLKFIFVDDNIIKSDLTYVCKVAIININKNTFNIKNYK